MLLREFLPWGVERLNGFFVRCIGIVRVQIVQGKLQELLLVLPHDLAFRKLLAVRWRWRWVCNLGDQVRCRCFCNAIDQDTQERNLEKDVEPNTEPKKYALTIMEPMLFLFFSEAYAREVRFKLCNLSVFTQRSKALFETTY